jgi:hypothetical protein
MYTLEVLLISCAAAILVWVITEIAERRLDRWRRRRRWFPADVSRVNRDCD